jgi:hypothetical protein
MSARYQCWQRKGTGELYAVRLVKNRVTGFHGPIAAGLSNLSALAHFSYNDDPTFCDWLERSEGDFLLVGS